MATFHCSQTSCFFLFLSWNHWKTFEINKKGWKQLKKVVWLAGRNTQQCKKKENKSNYGPKIILTSFWVLAEPESWSKYTPVFVILLSHFCVVPGSIPKSSCIVLDRFWLAAADVFGGSRGWLGGWEAGSRLAVFLAFGLLSSSESKSAKSSSSKSKKINYRSEGSSINDVTQFLTNPSTSTTHFTFLIIKSLNPF